MSTSGRRRWIHQEPCLVITSGQPRSDRWQVGSGSATKERESLRGSSQKALSLRLGREPFLTVVRSTLPHRSFDIAA
jgi:hypothetical protein